MSHINKKTYIYLKIIFKSLEFFVKASIPLKMSSKSLNKPQISMKMFTKSLVILIKASHLQSKASSSLKLSLKSLKIGQSVSHHWKKPSFLFKCFKKASDFFLILTSLSKSLNSTYFLALQSLKTPHMN
jgi:hypothetical protein